MKTEICKTCKKPFNLGYNGTIHGCDKCTGVQRDNTPDRAAWMPDELVQVRQSVQTGEVFTITRDEAFSGD